MYKKNVPYSEIPFGVRWSCEEARGTRDWFVRQGCSLSL